MKTTIELPDDLVMEIKIEAARQRKKLKELVPDLVRAGLRTRRNPEAPSPPAALQWLEEWVALGSTATGGQSPSPTATDILAADRHRLECE